MKYTVKAFTSIDPQDYNALEEKMHKVGFRVEKVEVSAENPLLATVTFGSDDYRAWNDYMNSVVIDIGELNPRYYVNKVTL